MTRPTARVLALLELLQSGGQRTVGSLAERLGVDERTVRRYVEHLADLGIPIETRRGRHGGYRLAPTYKLPPLMLTDDEAVAVLLGLEAGRRAGLLTGQTAGADSALAKIRRVLPVGLTDRLASLLATARYTAEPRSGVAAEVAVLLTLADAAMRRNTVSMEYTSWDGRAGRRTVDGYGLVFHNGRWYLTGFDHQRTAVRTFRLDRIAEAEATEDRYEMPADFDPAARVLSGIAAVTWATEVVVVLHTTLEEAQRQVPLALGQLTEVPGGVRLRARVDRLDGMARTLAGFGWDFTVEQPPALRTEVRDLGDRLRASAERESFSSAPGGQS
jgi:predicted DNA-binding transcriptional regulator YafY